MGTNLNRDGLKGLLNRYAVADGSDAALRFLRYLELLEKWNARVNLTASTDWEALAPLIEEAVWAAGFYPDSAAAHLDIGSGAGFPAIPMRLLRPGMRLTMIEPRGKRAAFLDTVCHELGLASCAVFNGRLAEFLEQGEAPQPWDFVSWKALRLGGGELSGLLAQCSPQTQFWLFHGASLPLSDENLLEPLRRESFPGKDSWYLSIMRRPVSRET